MAAALTFSRDAEVEAPPAAQLCGPALGALFVLLHAWPLHESTGAALSADLGAAGLNARCWCGLAA